MNIQGRSGQSEFVSDAGRQVILVICQHGSKRSLSAQDRFIFEDMVDVIRTVGRAGKDPYAFYPAPLQISAILKRMIS